MVTGDTNKVDFFNFSGGTLTTSNAANALASDLVIAGGATQIVFRGPASPNESRARRTASRYFFGSSNSQ